MTFRGSKTVNEQTDIVEKKTELCLTTEQFIQVNTALLLKTKRVNHSLGLDFLFILNYRKVCFD